MSRKVLSIIIPFYGQTEKQLAIPLGSINGQIGIDFSQIDVHLINDGGITIDNSLFKIFDNLDIYLHNLPKNKGPGVARQFGIDNSVGEYLMFIDADDLLGGPGILRDFLKAIDGKRDFICSSYVEETKYKGDYNYIVHDALGNQGAVYAKIFQRKMLIDNNIRFHPNLRIFEDQYFINIVNTFSKQKGTLQQPAYIWKFREDSLFRNSLNKNLSEIHIYARSLRYQIEFFKSRGLNELTQFTLMSLIKIYQYQKKYGKSNRKETVYQECRDIISITNLKELGNKQIFIIAEQLFKNHNQSFNNDKEVFHEYLIDIFK